MPDPVRRAPAVSSLRPGKGHVSLARAISKLGIASRAQGEVLIRSGKVRVDGIIERNPGAWVDLRRQRVVVVGCPAPASTRVYVAMHKPGGVVTTRSDELGRRTAYDFLPAGIPWVFPIGRLDKDSSGLILFSNDTHFGELMTDPVHHVEKVYVVTLDHPLDIRDRKTMTAGMKLADGTALRPVRVQVDPGRENQLVITLREGKNRQIRRMCAALGYQVLALHRIAIGPIKLAGLAEGKTRFLHTRELPLLGAERGEG